MPSLHILLSLIKSITNVPATGLTCATECRNDREYLDNSFQAIGAHATSLASTGDFVDQYFYVSSTKNEEKEQSASSPLTVAEQYARPKRQVRVDARSC